LMNTLKLKTQQEKLWSYLLLDTTLPYLKHISY
jgi:hypothetical protein